MDANVFLKGWTVGARLRGRSAAPGAGETGGGSGRYDKTSFLAGLAAGFASRGAPPWARAIGELPGWVPQNAVIHKIWSVNGSQDEIGVIFAVDDGAVIQKSGVCVYPSTFGFAYIAWYYTYAIISETNTFQAARCYYHNGRLTDCDSFETLNFQISGNVKYFQTMFMFDHPFYNPYTAIYGSTVFGTEAALGEYMGAEIPKN